MFHPTLAMRLAAGAALAALVLATPGQRHVSAQGLLDIGAGAVLDPGPDPRWTFTIGALGAFQPEYEGSDDYEINGFPLIDIRYGQLFFASFRDGIGINIINHEWLKFAPVVRYRFGRDQDDNPALRGLGDVGGTVELGALATIGPGPVRLRLEAAQGVNGDGHKGFQSRADLTYATRLGGVNVGFGPSVTWASENFNQSYFGITPDQSVRSGYRVYSPGSGFKDVGFGLSASYPLGGGFALTGIADYKRLLGDVADSPIVRDENQWFVGIGLSWRGSL